MSNEFQISSEIRDNCLIFSTSGYINNYGGEKILEEFNKYPLTDYNKLIINLQDSHVINSIGISFLIEIIETITENSYKLIFTNLDSGIDNTFEIMDIFQFSLKAESVEEAISM